MLKKERDAQLVCYFAENKKFSFNDLILNKINEKILFMAKKEMLKNKFDDEIQDIYINCFNFEMDEDFVNTINKWILKYSVLILKKVKSEIGDANPSHFHALINNTIRDKNIINDFVNDNNDTILHIFAKMLSNSKKNINFEQFEMLSSIAFLEPDVTIKNKQGLTALDICEELQNYI